MPGHKAHVAGGVGAFGVALIVMLMLSISLGKLPNGNAIKQYSLFMQLPYLITSLEQVTHTYFPLMVVALNRILMLFSPWLFVVTEWILCAVAGAMFPDIDIKSRSQKYLYGLFLIALLVCINKKNFDAVALMSVISLVPIFAKHRGLFHRWWFVVGLAILFWFWVTMLFPHASVAFFYYLLFFTAGAISHLWLDMGIKKMVTS